MSQVQWRKVIVAALFCIAIMTATGWVGESRGEETYPTRAIDIIVPFSPGGSTDTVARVISYYFKELWKVPVNVINKPGGMTVPACLEVHKAAPDGYTLLMDGNPSSSLLSIAVKELPFKIQDRSFIALADAAPMIFTTSASNSPFKTLKDAAEEAKKNPGTFSWTSNVTVGVNDYGVRQFFKAIGVDVLKTKPVIDQGGSQSATNTAGGHVKLGCASIVSSLPAVKGGLLRPLAVTCPSRWPDLPDVPTTAELGYPTVTAQNWHGPSGPPGLPAYVIEKWNEGLKKMVSDPAIVSKLKSLGTIPFYHNAQETREIVLKDMAEARELWGMK